MQKMSFRVSDAQHGDIWLVPCATMGSLPEEAVLLMHAVSVRQAYDCDHFNHSCQCCSLACVCSIVLYTREFSQM